MFRPRSNQALLPRAAGVLLVAPAPDVGAVGLLCPPRRPRASSTWRCASPSRPRCSGSASSSADRERSRIAQGVPRIRPLASGPAVFALALPDDEKQRKMRALKYTRQDSNLQPSVPKTDALSIELRVRAANRSGFAGGSTAGVPAAASGGPPAGGRPTRLSCIFGVEVCPGGRRRGSSRGCGPDRG